MLYYVIILLHTGNYSDLSAVVGGMLCKSDKPSIINNKLIMRMWWVSKVVRRLDWRWGCTPAGTEAVISAFAVGPKAEIAASVSAGVHWRASSEGIPVWGPNRLWPGSGLVLRCLGPGFTVLARGPGREAYY